MAMPPSTNIGVLIPQTSHVPTPVFMLCNFLAMFGTAMYNFGKAPCCRPPETLLTFNNSTLLRMTWRSRVFRGSNRYQNRGSYSTRWLAYVVTMRLEMSQQPKKQRLRCVENDFEAKIRWGHERDQLTKGHVKALQECGVQPLTQYSTVGATTFQGTILIRRRDVSSL